MPSRSCDKTYIGETGRTFNTRKKEHQKEREKETAGRLTRTQKEKAEQENLKSATSDHCWNNARIIRSESNKHKRWIKEAIEIRKQAQNTIDLTDLSGLSRQQGSTTDNDTSQ